MSEHTPTPWRVKPETTLIEQFENGLWGLTVADCHMTDEGAANAAFIVKAVNSHDALVKALELLEKAEEFHANCEECNGEDIPELCEKCFPHYDNARVARRLALHSLVGGPGQ